jgi:predicted RecB family nuclease
MAKQGAKKVTKQSKPRKISKKVASKIQPKSNRAFPAKKAAKKKIAKKVDKPKRKRRQADPTVIIKQFEKIILISHPVTALVDHPLKSGSNKASIYGINGMSGNTLLKFHSAGIKTIEDFANAGLSKISNVLGWSEKGSLPFFLRGLAVFHNRVIKIKELKSISRTPIYLDIETDLYQITVWMIGIYISKTNEFIQLVVDKPQDESKVIKRCLEILSDHPNEPIISYSGSRFDERVLRKRFDGEKLKHNHLVFDDILLDIKASLAFPLKAYTLGDLGEFYGYNFKHPNMDGREVAILYAQHSRNLKKFTGYKKLCSYNEDDVKSMAALVEHIYLK